MKIGKVYIVVLVLKGYAKADLGKEITRSCKALITFERCDRIISFKDGMIEKKSSAIYILGKLWIRKYLFI